MVGNYALKAISDAFFQGTFASSDHREVVLAHIEDGVDKLRVIQSLEERIKNLEMLNAREQRHRNELEDMNKTLEFDVRRARDRAVSFEMRIRVLEAMNADEREARVEQNYAALNQAEEFKSKIRILQATIADERQARINQEDEARMYREQAEHFEAEVQRYDPIVTPAPEESLSDGPVIQPGPARMVAIIESPIADGPALYRNGAQLRVTNSLGSMYRYNDCLVVKTPKGQASLNRNVNNTQPITMDGPWFLWPSEGNTKAELIQACQAFLSAIG